MGGAADAVSNIITAPLRVLTKAMMPKPPKPPEPPKPPPPKQMTRAPEPAREQAQAQEQAKRATQAQRVEGATSETDRTTHTSPFGLSGSSPLTLKSARDKAARGKKPQGGL